MSYWHDEPPAMCVHATSLMRYRNEKWQIKRDGQANLVVAIFPQYQQRIWSVLLFLLWTSRTSRVAPSQRDAGSQVERECARRSYNRVGVCRRSFPKHSEPNTRLDSTAHNSYWRVPIHCHHPNAPLSWR